MLYNNKLVVFGGFDGKQRYNDLRELDLEILMWKKLPSEGNVPLTRFGHSASVFEQSMFIFGGWDGHETLDDIFQYSFTTNF